MTIKDKTTGKKNEENNKSSKSGKSNGIITFLNYFLFCLLVVLVFYEVMHFKKLKTPSEETLPVVAEKPQKTPEQEDLDYLKNALYFDESNEETVPDIVAAINDTQVKEPEPVSQIWEEMLAHINTLDTPTEDVYGLYEEKLPDNIIKRPKISTIKVDVAQKPPHFDGPVIAIVIDDMGISHKRTADISSLKYPITASFLTYGTELDRQVENSIASGQEIIAHLPMEPKVAKDLSPDVLTIKMTDKQIEDGLEGMLKKFSAIKGANNHMGSRFTEDEKRMNVVMKVLEKKKMFFLDSKTTSKSAVEKAAKKHGVDYVSRNVFLDNKDDFKYIMGQLKQTENIAKKEGYAIAIGHPKVQTYNALKAWLPTLEEKSIKLVPLSEIVKVLNYKEN